MTVGTCTAGFICKMAKAAERLDLLLRVAEKIVEAYGLVLPSLIGT